MSWKRDQRQVQRVGRPFYGRSAARSRQPMRLPSLPFSSRLLVPVASIVLMALIVTIIHRSTNVKTIRIQGAQGINAGRLTEDVWQGVDRQWFGKSLLLLNAHSLDSYLREAEPALKKLEIHRRFPHTLLVTITERQPSLNWKSRGQLYLLDSDGTVIGESKGEYLKLPVVSDSTDLPVKVGDRVAPSVFVAFCRDLSAQLAAAKVKVVEMQVPATTSEVYIKTDAGYIIKFDTSRSPAGEVEDLQAVLGELAKQHKAPAQYIDLRIEHKAYYK